MAGILRYLHVEQQQSKRPAGEVSLQFGPGAARAAWVGRF
jgi:hypothetical protein